MQRGVLVAIAMVIALLAIAVGTALTPECGPANSPAMTAQASTAFPYCVSWYHPGSTRSVPLFRHI